jgi:hypothetical protein
MKSLPHAALALLTSLFMALPAQADQMVEIARLTMVLQGERWSAQDAASFSLPIDGGVSGVLPGSTKLLVLKDADGLLQAIFLVRANWGQGDVESTGTCPTSKSLYVRDFNNGGFQAHKCVMFTGVYTSSSLLTHVLDQLAAVQKTVNLPLPDTGHGLWMSMRAASGEGIEIEGLVADGFKGLVDRAPGAALPPDLTAAQAAWADALGEAAIDALGSFRGRVIVPALDFEKSGSPQRLASKGQP